MRLGSDRGGSEVARRLCLVSLVVSLLVGHVTTKGLDHDKERWLADESFYDVYTDSERPQSDSGLMALAPDLCPPVPQVLPPGGCDVRTCSSDRQCSQLKCCYNGCVYTCLPEVKAAPHFDWFREPRRRFRSGQSWLIPGAEDMGEVETCSTTPPGPGDDSDMLLCPHGYKCSIISEGRPGKGIPNRGICVREKKKGRRRGGWSLGLKSRTKGPLLLAEDSEIQHACPLGGGQVLLNGHDIKLEGKTCFCRDTKLDCKS